MRIDGRVVTLAWFKTPNRSLPYPIILALRIALWWRRYLTWNWSTVHITSTVAIAFTVEFGLGFRLVLSFGDFPGRYHRYSEEELLPVRNPSN